ncbi:MAG: transposase [Planctomycetaceae bacterium]|nr:transposase [Planctomycetaceae bacterium]
MAESPVDIDKLGLDELKALLVQALTRISALEIENQQLRDEVARLKGLKGKPEIKPSGMEKNAKPRSGNKGGGKGDKNRGRGKKNDRLKPDETKIIKADNVPAGSVRNGYEDYLVCELIIKTHIILYRRERWLTPDSKSLVAALPKRVSGGFGPGLKRYLLAQYYGSRVTIPCLLQQMTDYGLPISQRSIRRFLSDNQTVFVDEATGVLHTGLETAKWVTTDDTGARHKTKNGYCTHIGNNHFAWFKTTLSKSRLNFLQLLRAGDTGYEINIAALDYMLDRGLPKKLIDQLANHEIHKFADSDVWRTHLESLGFDKIKKHPDPVRIASEGAVWGRIATMGLLENVVIVSDGAGQFKIGRHALCWVHAERLVYKLVPVTTKHQKAQDRIRRRIWWLYANLKQYCHDPTAKRKRELQRRFDSIFTSETGFVLLDRLLKRLHAQKDDMLRVLDHPEIPLHTNGSENDIRCEVTKRKISGGTRSDTGRQCRDAFLSLMKTCTKLGVSFWDYLGCRLNVPGADNIPSLPDLICAQAKT